MSKKMFSLFKSLTFFLIIFIAFSETVSARLIHIKDIVFIGNKTISKEELRSNLDLNIGRSYSNEELDKALMDLFELGYFQEMNPSLQHYQGGYRVIIDLVELPVARGINISGNTIFSRQDIMADINIDHTKAFNYKHFKKSLESLIVRYQEKGFILAKVTGTNINKNGIIQLDINEGYLNNIVIKGNKKTKDRVILRELTIKRGDIINYQKIKKDLGKLFKRGYFQNIEISFDPVDEQYSSYDLILEFEEAKTGGFYPGVDWNSQDGLSGIIEIEELNFLGNGQVLEFDWEFGKEDKFYLSFQEPWFLNTKTDLGFSIFNKTEIENNSTRGDYREESNGGSISSGYPLNQEWSGKISLNFKKTSIIWSETGAVEKSKNNSINIYGKRYNTDNLLNPGKGYNDLYSIEYTGPVLDSDFNYTKLEADLRRYYEGFDKDQSWAVRLKTGISRGELPVYEKYYLGGSGGLRGYNNGSLAGDNMTLASVEYRFPLIDRISAVAFLETGKTWNNPSLDFDLNDFRYSYGTGLRLQTPLGLIRIDLGYNEEGDHETHINIGQSF